MQLVFLISLCISIGFIISMIKPSRFEFVNGIYITIAVCSFSLWSLFYIIDGEKESNRIIKCSDEVIYTLFAGDSVNTFVNKTKSVLEITKVNYEILSKRQLMFKIGDKSYYVINERKM